jgi:hypothetical protein
MWGSSNLKSKKQFIMKTKSFFSLAILMLAMSMSVTAQTYTKDPTLCVGMGATWDATARTFKVNNLKAGIQAPWVAYVTDPTWASATAYVDLTDYNFTPGATTTTSNRLDTKYGDVCKGGANGVSSLDVAIKSVNNSIPKNTQHAEDCFVMFTGSDLCGTCKGVTPLYCDKFDLKFNGSVLTLSGINNCVTYNNYLFQNADYSDWASIPITIPDVSNPDVAVADVKDVIWYNGKTKVYPFQDGTTAYMNSNDKGGGPSGQIKPGYCSKSFPAPTSVNEVAIVSVVAYPNPAVASETVTVTGSFDADSKVSILGVNGQLVSTVNPSISYSGLSFAAPAIGAGIYVIKIESASAVSTAMLLIK